LHLEGLCCLPVHECFAEILKSLLEGFSTEVALTGLFEEMHLFEDTASF
jgi:hypothetical protein